MRRHQHLSLSLKNAARYLEKTLLEKETHTSETAFTLRIGKSYTMKSCIWKDCSNDATGGAISYSSSSATSDSLIVQSCSFISCRSTKNKGGAVSVTNINIVIIDDSYFEGCRCATGDGNCGGGAIYWGTVITQPMARLCNFIRCVAGDEGGALSSRTNSLNEHFVVQNARIVGCNGTTNDGGALMLGVYGHSLCCTSVLFSACHCNQRGGALWSSYFSAASDPLLRFCFFTQNTAQSNDGHDTYIYGTVSPNPMLHCFSTTTKSSRVHPSNKANNWLPQGELKDQI